MSQRTILFIDDEPDLLNSLGRALRHEPFQIWTARTADESVAILKAHPVDLVVSDHNMPGMSGMDFLDWMGREFPDIPRIMLSGQIDATLRSRADESQVQFFAKPCSATELAKVICEKLKISTAAPL